MSLKFDCGSLVDTLDRTLGRTTGLRPVTQGPAWDPAAPPGGGWRIPLLDNAGEEVGAVIANTGAVVLLGGSLIMLPETSMLDQAAEGRPSPPVLDAYAEVVNVLRGVLNNTHRNTHVVPGTLAPCSSGAGWPAAPGSRLELAAVTPLGPIRMAFLGL